MRRWSDVFLGGTLPAWEEQSFYRTALRGAQASAIPSSWQQARATVAFFSGRPGAVDASRPAAASCYHAARCSKRFCLEMLGLAASNYVLLPRDPKDNRRDGGNRSPPVCGAACGCCSTCSSPGSSGQPRRACAGVILAVGGCVLAIGVFAWVKHVPFLVLATGSVKLNLVGVLAAQVAAIAFAVLQHLQDATCCSTTTAGRC